MGVRERPRGAGRLDWSTWPAYDAAVTGLKGYWYPVAWASSIGTRPTAFTLGDARLALVRDGHDGDGRVYALHDRCPHRGTPLSMGRQNFPGTLSCAYHGWTYDLASGRLVAVLTDGPESRICGKVTVATYPVEERLGLVWVYLPRADETPHQLDEQLPEELVAHDAVIGGRIDDRRGNWRFATENGYDEGHAKYLHRTSLWRLFKTMPAWNVTHIERHGRWIYRVQDEVHWESEFPGVGTWTNYRWWKQRPPQQTFNIGNTGAARKVNPVIAAQGFPGFASLTVPGMLRIAYPNFVHYEFYVPSGPDAHRYVGLMANFVDGWRVPWFYAKYLGAIRWLFHGQFSRQDARMVEATDAPPERLYRPDVSLTEWRKLCEEAEAGRAK